MSKSQNQTAEEYLSDIKKLGNSVEAINKIEKLLEDYPDLISGWLELGLMYRELGDRKQALETLEKASKLAPNNPKIKLELSTEQLYFNQFAACHDTIQQILEKDSKNIWAILKSGEIYRQENNRSEALKTFQKAVKLRPEIIWTNINLATELKYFGRFKEAEEQLKEALDFHQNEIHLLLQLGELARQQQDRNQALQYFQKALVIAPKNLWANLNLAIEFREVDNLETAEKYLKLALKYHPGNYQVLMELGQLERKRKKWDLALEYFQQAIDNYPTKLEAYLGKLEILFNLENLEQAQSFLEILNQKFPTNPHVLIHSGHLAKKIGQSHKALKFFRLAQAKADNPEQNLSACILVVEELANIGRLEKAKKLIDRVIGEFPDNIPAKIIKGQILGQQLEITAAEATYKEILSLEPNHLKSRLELAQIYGQSGQIKKAINLLEETYQLLGNNVYIFLQLGTFHEALEDWSTAAKWYQKSCQEEPLNPHGYCKLANLIFLQGETESAIKLLQKAQANIPDSSSVLIRLIEFEISLGNLDSSHQLLINGLHRFPHNCNLRWQLCRVYMAQGNYSEALELLDTIATDNQDWMKQTEELRANIYFYLYDYQKAEKHFKQAISLTTAATEARNRLATIFMLTGRVNEARQELKIATKELTRKNSLGKTLVPLKGHAAMVTNQLRTNPLLMAKLQTAQQATGSERILEFGSLLTQEPTYLGTALYLARELRAEGIFDNLQQALAQNSTNISAIPRRIVQFWNETEPPEEVQRICQSWIDCNPEYEYIRFSLDAAVAFLEEHYDQKVITAFANCEQPATQADFFRLAYLNKMGGFYADVDDLCRQSLDNIVNLYPELVVVQEDFACIGNNFLGCIPGQRMIATAFNQAVNRLSYYCNDSPWFKTGPGLITSIFCSGLLPYITYRDYQSWPRLLVLSQAELRKIIHQHISLPYKRTAKNWQHNAYQKRIQVTANQ